MDARVMRMVGHPLGRLLWRLYTLVVLLLCLPFLLAPILIWGALLTLLVLSIVHQSRGLAFLVVGLIGVLALSKVATRSSEDLPASLPLSQQASPQLFEVIDQVVVRLEVPPLHRVHVYFDANAFVEQTWTWRPRPRFERRLNLGLLAFDALTVTQLKASLAHEMAHFCSRDTLFGLVIANTLSSLEDLYVASRYLKWVLILVRGYERLLVRFTLRAMRRHEYTANRIAAQAYGPSATLAMLINLSAMAIEFKQYLPSMASQFSSGVDRHDFYHQFSRHWRAMRPERREVSRAKAVASFRSAGASHPTYQDLYQAMRLIEESPQQEQDDRSASTLLPNIDELGRELTIQLVRTWVKQGYMID